MVESMVGVGVGAMVDAVVVVMMVVAGEGQ
jgi:hypothetical protein